MPRESAKADPALARVLRELREARGLAQEAVAFRAGISTGSVARNELAQVAPSWSTIVAFARGLGISLGELGRLVDAEHAKREAP